MDARGSILQGEPLELLSRSCCRLLLQFAAEGEVGGGGGTLLQTKPSRALGLAEPLSLLSKAPATEAGRHKTY